MVRAYAGCRAVNLLEHAKREYRTHTEIKITYDGELGERIPAYLLIPRTAPLRKFPAIFTAHQCAWACDLGKEQVVGKCVDWPDQAYGLELVREGFVVIAPDANKVGERFDPNLRKQWQTALELGNSQHACCIADGGPWGSTRWKRIFDVSRGIDVLCQHPMVDADRIGMIGHSLGADTTLWVMPLEDRIKVGVISCGGLMGLARNYHGLPFIDLLHLIAPRPFFESVGNEDYPSICGEDKRNADPDERMKAKREAHEKARGFYALFGKEQHLELFEFDGGHQFPEPARKAAYVFLKRHLM